MNYDTIVRLVADTENAVEPPPGKFERNPDLRVAEALFAMSLEDTLDAWSGSPEQPEGWNARIGRFVINEDVQGFFTYRVFASDTDAEREFERMHGAVYDE